MRRRFYEGDGHGDADYSDELYDAVWRSLIAAAFADAVTRDGTSESSMKILRSGRLWAMTRRLVCLEDDTSY